MERLSAGAVRRTPLRVSLLALVVLPVLAPPLATRAAAALLENGTLREGTGTTPTAWRPDAWNPDATRFGWEADGERGTLALENPVPNDARWCQTVTVTPGATYRISAEVRTENVGGAAAGAFIAVEPRIGHSRLLDGTAAWQSLELTLEAAGPERTWDVCLRLGSNGSLNTGSAWFRNVAMRLIGRGRPAPRGPSVFTRATQWIGQTGWAGTLLPLLGGAVLAFGFGLFQRRSPPGN